MQITIKTPDGRLITFEVDLSDTIESVKARIQDKEGTPTDQQQLFLDGKASKPLENDQTIGDYDIRGGSTLNLCVTVVTDREGSCCNII
jgi:hypothetical protein